MVGRIEVRNQDPLKQIESQAGPNSLLLLKKETTGFINRKTFVNLVVWAPNAAVANLKSLGLFPVHQYRINIKLRRISDVNGWGTGVNGETSRIAQKDFKFQGQNILSGIHFMQSLSNNNYQALQKVVPQEYKYILENKEVVMFERGFDLHYTVSLVVGEEHLGNEVIIYQVSQQIGYFSL